MDCRLTILVCLAITAAASAYPSEDAVRHKRDVMESMKNAWNEVVKTLSDAGDAVVHVFKPTEKSVLDKMADGVNDAGSAVINALKPTEKSTFEKMADGIKSLGQ